MYFALVVINTLACFVAGFFLLKPTVRKIYHSAIFGALLYVEGLWSMANYIISGIWPDNSVMDIIKNCISIVLAIIIIYIVCGQLKKTVRPKKNMRQITDNDIDS